LFVALNPTELCSMNIVSPLQQMGGGKLF